MSDLLRRIPVDSKEPVNLVCYHPVQVQDLLAGENVEPKCLAVDYEYDSFLHELCVELGWQGGTRQQVIDEIRKLRAAVQRTTSQSTPLNLVVRNKEGEIKKIVAVLG